jgi:tRNA/rRNA methyltransferase
MARRGLAKRAGLWTHQAMSASGSQPAFRPGGEAALAAGAAPCIVLVEPQLGENIGATARAMANFGLTELRLVAPRDGWPNPAAAKAASGAVAVIEGARVFDDAAGAVADLAYVLATTARRRDAVKPVLNPESAAGELAARARRGERAGVLFGRERTGLGNDEVALADAIVMAPVNPAFASLNLAQAVLLVGYEWRKLTSAQSLGRRTEVQPAGQEGLQLPGTRPATRAELIGLFEHLERELDATGFLRPPEKRPAMVRSLRNMMLRQALTEQDVRTLRGVISALTRAYESPRRRAAGQGE